METSLQEQSNAYGEGEGACFVHIVKQHNLSNCLFVANDTDSILYALLAGATREREREREREQKLHVRVVTEITFTQKSQI